MKPRPAEFVLRIDTSRITAAFQRLADAIRDLTITPPAHAVHGPRNFQPDGTWLSDLCSAWVHDTCPAPGWCHCHCHQET